MVSVEKRQHWHGKAQDICDGRISIFDPVAGSRRFYLNNSGPLSTKLVPGFGLLFHLEPFSLFPLTNNLLSVPSNWFPSSTTSLTG